MRRWFVAILMALFILWLLWALLSDEANAAARHSVLYSRAAVVAALEGMFNARPGMKVSRDIPGVGNRLLTYEGTELRSNDTYAIIVTVRKW